MRKIPKSLYQFYKWLFLFPFILLLTIILGLGCIVAALTLGEKATNIFAVAWAKAACFFVPVKVKVLGEENFSIEKSYIIVANHQSMADIIILQAYIKLTIKWIMKKELGSIPIFGFACQKLGCIYVDRFNHASALASMRVAQKRLSKTSSVIFFPEGTRTRDGKLLDFKKGAFRFAMATGIPILPVTIKDSMDILPADSLDVSPGSTTIIVHPPINMKNRNVEELDKILSFAKKTIASAL
ncbi:MAG: 1-acyl-sn-glycerol-3-phosphate acyltransferase [Desulfobacteraceae bacterium]|nr:1-acyl-sn-glycerol-3-phosphate acyltransferase [Desulfobacteraceae bacterium]